MSAQAALQTPVSEQRTTEAKPAAVVKQVAPVMREMSKPAKTVEQPRYDFVGIAG
ncbi:MAG: hypothetical protein OQK12_17375 [Motiliproteus sp.]|nr:hypothetical protein [Motiliproteus sp.]MCW9054194.1 hypothetical protein [Motiliproteus sp.]